MLANSMRLLLLCSALLVSSASIADEPDDEDVSQLKTWIEMLDAPKYRDRAEATAKLQRSGGLAIEALERVVIRGSSEASDRALGILEQHYNDDDEILKDVASEALQRIAAQDEHGKSTAAKRILETAESTPTDGPLPNLPLPNLRFPNLAPVNRQTKIRITITNGAKDITVEEDGKSIRVIDRGDGIEVEKKNGNGKIAKTKYKDAEELKEKDADAHKAYQKAGAGGDIRIQMHQNGIPNLPGQLQIVPQPLQLQKQLEEMQRQLEETRKRHAETHQKQLKRHEEMLEKIRKMRAIPPALPPLQEPIETKIVEPLEV